MGHCGEPRCRAPLIACYHGESAPEVCSHWRRGRGSKAALESAVDPKRNLLPWSGSALGTADLGFLTARADPKLVALLGPHNAGKTTLLGAWYLLFGRSGSVGERRFAGSYSLEGWEAVAHALRWEGSSPAFPPHTSSRSGRAPGLLHLALRDAAGRLQDILFADAPGEWFQRWAVESDAVDAVGARWLADRASVLGVVADCQALSGKERGNARQDMIQLLRRAADVRRGRSVALIWTKADVEVPSGIRDAVRQAALNVMPDIAEFWVSIVGPSAGGETTDAASSLENLLAWATSPLPKGIQGIDEPVAATEPFFAMGMR